VRSEDDAAEATKEECMLLGKGEGASAGDAQGLRHPSPPQQHSTITSITTTYKPSRLRSCPSCCHWDGDNEEEASARMLIAGDDEASAAPLSQPPSCPPPSHSVATGQARRRGEDKANDEDKLLHHKADLKSSSSNSQSKMPPLRPSCLLPRRPPPHFYNPHPLSLSVSTTNTLAHHPKKRAVSFSTGKDSHDMKWKSKMLTGDETRPPHAPGSYLKMSMARGNLR